MYRQLNAEGVLDLVTPYNRGLFFPTPEDRATYAYNEFKKWQAKKKEYVPVTSDKVLKKGLFDPSNEFKKVGGKNVAAGGGTAANPTSPGSPLAQVGSPTSDNIPSTPPKTPSNTTPKTPLQLVTESRSTPRKELPGAAAAEEKWMSDTAGGWIPPKKWIGIDGNEETFIARIDAALFFSNKRFLAQTIVLIDPAISDLGLYSKDEYKQLCDPKANNRLIQCFLPVIVGLGTGKRGKRWIGGLIGPERPCQIVEPGDRWGMLEMGMDVMENENVDLDVKPRVLVLTVMGMIDLGDLSRARRALDKGIHAMCIKPGSVFPDPKSHFSTSKEGGNGVTLIICIDILLSIVLNLPRLVKVDDIPDILREAPLPHQSLVLSLKLLLPAHALKAEKDEGETTAEAKRRKGEWKELLAMVDKVDAQRLTREELDSAYNECSFLACTIEAVRVMGNNLSGLGELSFTIKEDDAMPNPLAPLFDLIVAIFLSKGKIQVTNDGNIKVDPDAKEKTIKPLIKAEQAGFSIEPVEGPGTQNAPIIVDDQDPAWPGLNLEALISKPIISQPGQATRPERARPQGRSLKPLAVRAEKINQHAGKKLTKDQKWQEVNASTEAAAQRRRRQTETSLPSDVLFALEEDKLEDDFIRLRMKEEAEDDHVRTMTDVTAGEMGIDVIGMSGWVTEEASQAALEMFINHQRRDVPEVLCFPCGDELERDKAGYITTPDLRDILDWCGSDEHVASYAAQVLVVGQPDDATCLRIGFEINEIAIQMGEILSPDTEKPWETDLGIFAAARRPLEFETIAGLVRTDKGNSAAILLLNVDWWRIEGETFRDGDLFSLAKVPETRQSDEVFSVVLCHPGNTLSANKFLAIKHIPDTMAALALLDIQERFQDSGLEMSQDQVTLAMDVLNAKIFFCRQHLEPRWTTLAGPIENVSRSSAFIASAFAAGMLIKVEEIKDAVERKKAGDNGVMILHDLHITDATVSETLVRSLIAQYWNPHQLSDMAFKPAGEPDFLALAKSATALGL